MAGLIRAALPVLSRRHILLTATPSVAVMGLLAACGSAASATTATAFAAKMYSNVVDAAKSNGKLVPRADDGRCGQPVPDAVPYDQ